MRLARTVLIATVALVLGAAPGRADDAPWRLRLYGFYMGTSEAPSFVDAAGTVLSSDNDSGAGLGLAAEYALSSRLGLELGVSSADHGDFRARAAGSGERVEASDTLGVTTLALSLNYHVTPGATADLHFGAVVAWLDFGDLAIRYDAGNAPPPPAPSAVNVGLDSSIALGLGAGLDLVLGDGGWLLYSQVRYLPASLDADVSGHSAQSVDYDPWTLGLGFGYRF